MSVVNVQAFLELLNMNPRIWPIPGILFVLTTACVTRAYGSLEGSADHDPYAVAEGDILTERNAGSTYGDLLLNNLLSKDAFRWPDGKVVYTLNASLDVEMKETVRHAMANITRTTNNCVRFAERIDETAFVDITRPLGMTSCAAEVGRLGRRQEVRLSSVCQFHDVMHELLHTLGFLHEHTRPDRDQYIQLRDDIPREMQANFDIRYDVTQFDLPYDFHSIMHYPGDGNRPFIKSLDPHRKLGVNRALSPLDIRKIHLAYRCENRETDICTIEAGSCAIYHKRLLVTDNRHRIWLNKGAGMRDCHALSQAAKSHVSIYCQPQATADDTASLVNTLQHRLEVLLYTVFVSDAVLIQDHQFNVIKEKIVHLWISTCMTEFTTSKLRQNAFPNLLDFGLHNCSRQRVGRSDFELYSKLRRLVFHATTIALIEQNAFDSLRDLQVLQLEEWWEPKYQGTPRKAELEQHAQLLHCSCDYQWLRDWLQSKPHLMEGKKTAEIYNESKEMTVGEIYLSINCRNVQWAIRKWTTYPTGRHSNKGSQPFSQYPPSCP